MKREKHLKIENRFPVDYPEMPHMYTYDTENRTPGGTESHWRVTSLNRIKEKVISDILKLTKQLTR